MFIDVTTSKFRSNLSAYLEHLHITGDRILLLRNGREVAALVSPKDLRALEKVEDSREEILEQRQAAQMREFRVMRDEMS